MTTTRKFIGPAFAIMFAGALALTGCSMGSPADTGEKESQTDTPMESQSAEAPTMDPAANLVGPGCAAYAEAVPEGEGSIVGMSQDPVAVAASNNPLLTTLVSAVSGELNPAVDLVDTLNGAEFTVFAPVDDAFAKVDPATITTLGNDSELLSQILTYHVVPGQIEPSDIVGSHDTVEGSALEVTGSGDDLTVNGANVICGGVQTANAVVYLVDSVLMPPAKQ